MKQGTRLHNLGKRMRWAGTLGVTGAVLVIVLLLSRGHMVKPGERLSSLMLLQRQLKPGQLAGWNLLLVTFDTLRADHVGCYGYTAAETPTVDGLAARGVLFEHAVTPVPATLPAHCTMMTGLEAPNHGVRTNGHFVLHDDRLTLAEILKDAGYGTAAFVATFVLDSRFGLGQGFDTYTGIDVSRAQPGQPRAQPRLAERQTDDSIAWLNAHFTEHGDRPFFLWTHYFDPHLPHNPPGDFGTRFADKPYDGEVAYADSQLKRLLDFIEARRRPDRTLIVFTSDHGEGLGEHLEKDHSRLIYDTTMHVPLIISCPPLHTAACRVDDVTVGLIDMMPTLLSLLGISTQLKMDGLNLLTARIPDDRAIYIETLAPMQYHGWASLHGLRRIHEKYIEAPHPEYYDLARDPHELHDLHGTDPDRYVDLVKLLDERMAQWPSAEEAIQPASRLSAGALRQLAALGYVSTIDDSAPESAIRPDPKDMVPIYEDLQRRDPHAWQAKSMTCSLRSDSDAGARRRALILAKYAVNVAPEDPACLLALGAAQYRLGDFDEAAATLTNAEQGFIEAGRPGEPAVGAFRAMTEYQLGRHGPARERLHSLQIAGSNRSPAGGNGLYTLLAEAKSLIEQE